MTRLQLHPAGLELADPQFRSLHIGQNADRPMIFLLDRANCLDPRRVIGVSTVGKIKTD